MEVTHRKCRSPWKSRKNFSKTFRYHHLSVCCLCSQTIAAIPQHFQYSRNLQLFFFFCRYAFYSILLMTVIEQLILLYPSDHGKIQGFGLVFTGKKCRFLADSARAPVSVLLARFCRWFCHWRNLTVRKKFWFGLIFFSSSCHPIWIVICGIRSDLSLLSVRHFLSLKNVLVYFLLLFTMCSTSSICNAQK